MKRFADLSEQEVLALAISNEDEDNRIYRSFADALRAPYPDTAQMYDKMAEEEISHRDMLLNLHREKFGEFCRLFAARTSRDLSCAGPSGSTGRWRSTPFASSPRRWSTRPRVSTAAPRTWPMTSPRAISCSS